MATDILEKYTTALRELDTISYEGVVSKSIGLLVESNGPLAGVGELCKIRMPDRGPDGAPGAPPHPPKRV